CRYLITFHHGQCFLLVRPTGEELASYNEVRACIQYAQKVPKLVDLGLYRRPGSEQDVLGAGPDPEHEVEKVVRFLPPVSQTATAPRLVGLVENYRTDLPLEQVLALVGVMKDQTRGDDSDAAGAPRDVFGSPGLDDVALRVDPHLLCG